MDIRAKERGERARWGERGRGKRERGREEWGRGQRVGKGTSSGNKRGKKGWWEGRKKGGSDGRRDVVGGEEGWRMIHKFSMIYGFS